MPFVLMYICTSEPCVFEARVNCDSPCYSVQVKEDVMNFWQHIAGFCIFEGLHVRLEGFY